MSWVARCKFLDVATWRMNWKVRALIVGLKDAGGVLPRASSFRRYSSPRAAVRALCLSYVPSGLSLRLHLTTVCMEDNSAVITITTDDQAYLKKCKHFLMVINYIREQVDLGMIEIQKIAGEDNMADLHTKPLRDGAFERHVPKILGEKRPASSLKHADG